MTATESQKEGVQLVTLRNLVGHTVSNAYRIDRVIGEGGMGIVFEANQLKLDRNIALKVLKLDGPNAQEAFARFEREIAILSNLTHPNIVRVLDSGHDGGLDIYYIAMDLISGMPLADLSEGFRFAPALALEIIYQTAGALAQPHNEEVIHRDLKPDNILLEVVADETIQVRLVDFGIARAFAADKKLTATGVVVGTPHYMAPELVREKDLDRRTDIYALGVMLHELLTGSLPFDGGNFMQIGFKHVQAPVPTLASKVHDLDMPDLEALVATMMAKEKEDRYESVAELRRAIERVVDENGFPRVRVDPTQRVDHAIDHLRVPIDGANVAPDSAEWLPQSTPGNGNDNNGKSPDRNAAEHTPLTTTRLEGSGSTILPLVVALIAVAVALVAVLVAINVSQSGDEAPIPLTENPLTETPLAENPEPLDDEAAAASPDELDAPSDVLAETPEDDSLPGTTASADSETAATEDPVDEPAAVAEEAPKPAPKPKPTRTAKKNKPRPTKKAPPSDDSKTNSKDDEGSQTNANKTFEEGIDWVTGSD